MTETRIEALSAEWLQKQVCGHTDPALKVVVHASVDSTSDWLMQQARQGATLPLACFAEEQTQGRGRRGKSWLLPPHRNIAMSLAWPMAADIPLNLLPLNIAMAVVDTLEAAGIDQVQVKWPNDVYVRGRKIAGILIDTFVRGQARVVITGIGLNYDVAALAGPERPPWTDVRTEAASPPGRNLLAADLLARVIHCCERFPREAAVRLQRFERDYDYCKNKTVEIITDNDETVQGLALGVNHQAELVVDIGGRLQTFNSAEVSVRAAPIMENDDSDD